MCWAGTANCDVGSFLLTIGIFVAGFIVAFFAARFLTRATGFDFLGDPHARIRNITDSVIATIIVLVVGYVCETWIRSEKPAVTDISTSGPKSAGKESTPARTDNGSPTAVCPGVTVPASSLSLASGEPRLCALIACAGGGDIAAGRKLVDWFRIAARKTGACDSADRDALSDLATFAQLHEARKNLTLVVTRPSEVDVCTQIVRDVIDDLERERRRLKSASYGVCSKAGTDAVSVEVQEYIRRLTH
jgi:hypothetical protein